MSSVTSSSMPEQPNQLPPIPTDMNQTAPPVPVLSPVAPARKPNLSLWLTGLLVALVGSLAVIYLTSPSKNQNKPVLTPGTTPAVVTMTPLRTLSPIASQSAFLLLQQSVASLSASLTTYAVEDPGLSPPVLDLPLGFAN